MTWKGLQEVWLAQDKADAFKAKADEQGANTGYLLHFFVVQGARLAQAGFGGRLPAAARAPRGTGPDLVKMRWRQGVEEHSLCVELIEAAGSSVTAVARDGVDRYLKPGVNVVTMRWAPKGVIGAAA